jgi:predicted GIY-YIG superfamily endonuclease
LESRTVYLIHFNEKYKHAGHYTGSCSNLKRRLEKHREGRGARLMEVITQAGIEWTVAATWKGDRELERKLKKRHGANRFCPICKAKVKIEAKAKAKTEGGTGRKVNSA